MIHDFYEKLEYSLTVQQKFDIAILKEKFGWTDVKKTPKEIDKNGIDYIVTLKDGAKINIDGKTREYGASKWWKYGEPELAIEFWSVFPTETTKGDKGWTFKENTNVDYILYTFHESDSNKFYLFPFQLLRTASIKHGKEWKNKYGIKTQPNERYESKAVFVPASVLINAVNEEMTGTYERTQHDTKN